MAYADDTDGRDGFTPAQPQPTEVPVNPYSLLEAVNSSSATARGAWVIFLAIMTFILVAVAGVTHRDLLLNTNVDLPILQVGIELTRFFLFAPILLLFVHFGLLIQHVMLSRKALEFDRSLRAMEATRKRNHPLRLELHSYFFTQALAGPHRGWLLAAFLHSMVWISLVVLPVLTILFTQVVFLPYHDLFITWAQRMVLIVDMLIVFSMGVFFRRIEPSFIAAFWRAARHHPVNFLATGILFICVLVLSLFVATIPGEKLDGITRTPSTQSPGQTASAGGEVGSGPFWFAVTDILRVGQDSGRKWLERMFSRNLVVNDLDLVPDKDDEAGEISINLRNRNLRDAILDRSDLHRADLTGADLKGASLVGADLRDARLSCPDVTSLQRFVLERAKVCANLEGANLNEANLDGANLAFSFLNRATFESASLVGANLNEAQLIETTFAYADLRRARLTGGVDLFGSNFLGANLRGAFLTGANLYGADFASAVMQGAILFGTRALGTNFTGAELDGAYLKFANLQGADLRGASLIGTNLSNVTVWQTQAPDSAAFKLVDTTRLALRPPLPVIQKSIREAIKQISDPLARERLQALLRTTVSDAWTASTDFQRWERLKVAGMQSLPNYSATLTGYLGNLACQIRWQDGAVANGVIERALAPSFSGDIVGIHRRLTGGSCPAEPNIHAALRQKLSAAVEQKQTVLFEIPAAEIQ